MAAPFVDTAKITVRSGSGGNGVVSFHRENMWPPAARTAATAAGGNVVVTVDDHMSTLMDFRYKRKYVAGNGAPGAATAAPAGTGRTCSSRCPGAPSSGMPPPARSSGICLTRPLYPVPGRPGRMGQPALCHPHPPGPPLRQARPAR